MSQVRFKKKMVRPLIMALLFISTSIINYKLHVVNILFFEPTVYNNFSYIIALLSTFLFIGVFIYNYLYQKFVDPNYKFSSQDWKHDDKAKRQIQVASMALVTAGISWNICLSSYWGMLTPLITLNISISMWSFLSLL
ncbi:hypothetical protein K502DRAFT_350940 [Neoconidiobolus thromboides FSU 785]|nr:hypothetical protein K502DRAFT_350940 [Neoconidiobolus thromboides FSU 785]